MSASNVLCHISAILPSITGWCSETKAHTLASAIMALRPETTVEIGVWGGKSLIPMAMAHQEIGFGRVFGIDPWSATASVQGQINPADRDWWANQDNHDMVFRTFQMHMELLRLQSCVTVLRSPSDEVKPPSNIGLFHCDGNHGEQALRDVSRFAPNVVPGGLVFVDDLGWAGGAVGLAVKKLELLGFRQLYTMDTGALFQRVK